MLMRFSLNLFRYRVYFYFLKTCSSSSSPPQPLLLLTTPHNFAVNDFAFPSPLLTLTFTVHFLLSRRSRIASRRTRHAFHFFCVFSRLFAANLCWTLLELPQKGSKFTKKQHSTLDAGLSTDFIYSLQVTRYPPFHAEASQRRRIFQKSARIRSKSDKTTGKLISTASQRTS